MRSLALIIAILVLPTVEARSAPAAPTVPIGTPYATARIRLIQQGYDPVQVTKRRRVTKCGRIETPCFPELMDCGAGAGWLCEWLYQRRSDGGFVIVETIPFWASMPSGAPGFRGLYDSEPHDLAKYEIVRPGSHERIYYCESGTTRGTPLCSVDSGAPCWVKPPIGYRPPQKFCR